MPYEGSDSIRIFDAPPFFLISVIILIIFLVKTTISKSVFDLKSPFLWFIIYLNITTIIINPSGLVYSLSWALNYFIFRYFIVEKKLFRLKYKNFFIIVLVLLSIGVFRLITGLDGDANPYALLNRNATSTIIIFFFVYYKTLYKNFSFLDILFISFLILNGSRSSILAATIFYAFLYLKGFNFKNILKFSIAFLIVFSILSTNENAVKRFNSGLNFLNQVTSDNVEEVGDFERVFLIRSGLMIFKENIFFGVGEGNKKYQEEFKRIVVGYDRDSRSHNFFVTRLANFGLIGFFLFLFGYYYELKSKKYFTLFSITFFIIFFFNEYVLLPQIFLISSLIPENKKYQK